MRKRKRLLVDVDEVLADFQGPMFEALDRLYGRKLGPMDCEVWDCFSLFTEEEREGVLAEIAQPGWAMRLQVKPGAKEALVELRTFVDVYAVTKPFPSPTWVHDRDAWLTANLGFTPGKDIVHTGAKHVCQGDAFLDDNPTHVVDWKEEHPHALAMLWDIPNTRLLGHEDIRVRSWDEAIQRVRGILV